MRQSLWNPSISAVRGNPQRGVREVVRKPEEKKVERQEFKDWGMVRVEGKKGEKHLLVLVTLRWLLWSQRKLRSEEALKKRESPRRQKERRQRGSKLKSLC